MNLELEDIILTIDTREQNQKRIKAVEDWAQGHGAIVEHSKLDLCDYRLIGEFRGVPVNIGIEAKSMSDFCSCGYEDLKEKLFNSFELYDEVALFIETGNYTYKFVEGVAVIDNPAVRDGSANVCPLAVLEGCCSTLPAYGIHVRQLRSETQFPDSIWNLLTYITGEHHLIKRTAKQNVRTYKQALLHIMTKLQAEKAMKAYPNLSWLCSASEESLKAVFGAKTGVQINEVLHFHELETDEWRNGYHRDGTFKPTESKDKHPDGEVCPVAVPKRCGEVNAYKCIGNSCIYHPNNPKLKKQDDEGRLAFDAPVTSCNPKLLGGHSPQRLNMGLSIPGSNDTPAKNPVMWDLQCRKCKIIQTVPIKERKLKCIKCGSCEFDTVSQHSSHSGKDISTADRHDIIPPSSLPSDTSQSLSTEVQNTSKLKGKPEINFGTHDTSSHSGTNSTPPIIPKPDDPHIPPKNSVVKQGNFNELFSPAETHEDKEMNVGLDGKPLETVIKCRACYQVIEPSNDDDTGFCHDPDCIKARKEPSLENKLRIYLREPHTIEEIIEKYGCSTGYTFQVCMANVHSGNLKKVTLNGKSTFQRVK